MKTRNLQRGFIPLLIIAIIAVLAIGGGAYVISKNKVKVSSDEKTEGKDESSAEGDNIKNMPAKNDEQTSVGAKGTLRSLLALGKNEMCTFTSTAGSTTSSGTTYIGADGSMSGDYTIVTSSGTVSSHMITKGGTSYMWSGTQGTKITMADVNTNTSSNANVSGNTNQSVDLDSQVDYKCSPWVRDESKFVVPTTVKFLDLSAMMKLKAGTTLPSNVDVNALIKAQGGQ